eukprot:scaffold7717_cov117-Isochrysis_galbana.AAC.5
MKKIQALGAVRLTKGRGGVLNSGPRGCALNKGPPASPAECASAEGEWKRRCGSEGRSAALALEGARGYKKTDRGRRRGLGRRAGAISSSQARPCPSR